jgi:acyl-CoA dehydrogenase
MDFSKDLALALEMAEIADRISLDRFYAQDLVVETKPDSSPVTDADRSVEDALKATLKEARPDDSLIGEEGRGFKYILDGLNAERTLIAAECIGDAWWFLNKVVDYSSNRIVFDRPIAQNQGVQFPIARSFVNTEAANLMRFRACELYDAAQDCGAEANMAKLLAADASWEAANVCLQFHGGFGFATEYDIERKFRETRLYQVAPISTNLILSYVAEHVLGLPRSF